MDSAGGSADLVLEHALHQTLARPVILFLVSKGRLDFALRYGQVKDTQVHEHMWGLLDKNAQVLNPSQGIEDVALIEMPPYLGGKWARPKYPFQSGNNAYSMHCEWGQWPCR